MVFEAYDRFVEEYKDPYIDHYFLMGSPIKILSITLLYWLFVKKIGPKFMENRQPYDLKNAMLVYNILQVVANISLVYLATKELLWNPAYKDWSCMRNTRLESPVESKLSYIYYMLKVADYTDTIFMVLRKRYRQVTFLHLYHHIIMGLTLYASTRFVGGGHYIALGLLNAIVHAVMYSYYFLSAHSENLKNSIWWKKHITQLQMAQFVFLIVHFARGLMHENCNQFPTLMWFCVIQNVFMLVMFSNFYIKSYVKKPIEKMN